MFFYPLKRSISLTLLSLTLYHKAIADTRPLSNFFGKTMGTYYCVKISEELPEDKIKLQQEIDALLEQVNNDISTYRKKSILSQFNRYQGKNPKPISSGIADIIFIAQRIGRATNNSMDITIGPLVNLWGFGEKKTDIVPNQEKINQARKNIGLQYLTLFSKSNNQWLQKDLPSLYVDLSTLGEGYAADLLAQLMMRKGISNYLISVGGAISSQGLNGKGMSWRVAIQKPTDMENTVQAVIDLKGYSTSTSGSYRNYFKQNGKHYSHVIDPNTGQPINHNLVSATVIAKTALEADAWDTGLMVLGAEKALKVASEQGLAIYLIIKTDNGFKTAMTPQFKTFLQEEVKP